LPNISAQAHLSIELMPRFDGQSAFFDIIMKDDPLNLTPAPKSKGPLLPVVAVRDLLAKQVVQLRKAILLHSKGLVEKVRIPVCAVLTWYQRCHQTVPDLKRHHNACLLGLRFRLPVEVRK
jgi:hypothetical protein